MSGFLDNTQINYVFQKEGREGSARGGKNLQSIFIIFFSPSFPLSGRALGVGILLLQNALPSWKAEPCEVPSGMGDTKDFWEPGGWGVGQPCAGMEMLFLHPGTCSHHGQGFASCATWPGSWWWLGHLRWDHPGMLRKHLHFCIHLPVSAAGCCPGYFGAASSLCPIHTQLLGFSHSSPLEQTELPDS